MQRSLGFWPLVYVWFFDLWVLTFGVSLVFWPLGFDLFKCFDMEKCHCELCGKIVTNISAGIDLLKVSKRNTRTRCEICSKLTTKTPERHQWRRSGVSIVNLEHISHLILVFLLLTLNMWLPAGVVIFSQRSKYIFFLFLNILQNI